MDQKDGEQKDLKGGDQKDQKDRDRAWRCISEALMTKVENDSIFKGPAIAVFTFRSSNKKDNYKIFNYKISNCYYTRIKRGTYHWDRLLSPMEKMLNAKEYAIMSNVNEYLIICVKYPRGEDQCQSIKIFKRGTFEEVLSF